MQGCNECSSVLFCTKRTGINSLNAFTGIKSDDNRNVNNQIRNFKKKTCDLGASNKIYVWYIQPLNVMRSIDPSIYQCSSSKRYFIHFKLHSE